MHNRRSQPFSRLLLAALLAAGVGTAGAAGEHAKAKGQDAQKQQYVKLPELLGLEEGTAPADVIKLIKKQFGNPQTSGAARHLDRKRIILLPVRQAAVEALSKNLDIQVGRKESERLREAIGEARAVFNPVFTISMGYDQKQTYTRKRVGTVVVRSFQPFNAVNPPSQPQFVDGANCADPTRCGVYIVQTTKTNPIQPSITKPEINRIGFIQQRTHLSTQEVYASVPTQSPNPTKTFNLDFQINQQLPWGSSFNLGVFSTKQRVNYDSRGDSYGRDYASNLAFSAVIPLPFTKNFGPYAPADAALKLSRKQAQRGVWDVKTIINSTLQSSDAAYWNLVRSLETLRLVAQNRALMEKQAAHTERLYQRGYSTSYAKAQVDAEVARLGVLEESAKNAVITASNNLGLLIEQNGDKANNILFMPSNYASLLDKYLVVHGRDAVTMALQHRPDLEAEKIQKQASDIVLKFRQQQTRPDVQASLSVNSNQNSSVVGFASYGESIQNLANPDQLDQSYTLNYNLPLFNHANKARYVQAKKLDEDQGVVIRSLENDITQQVNDALANIYSARARVDTAERNAKLAQEAYKKLVRKRALGGNVPELELITKSQDILSAKQDLLNALVDNKIAESQLLAAEGIIANRYPELTSQNSFDRKRLRALSRHAQLRYFAPTAVKTVASGVSITSLDGAPGQPAAAR